mgnify:CR=1 FL=1
MKVKIAKNGDVIYRRGLKTLITNNDAEVSIEIFEAKSGFSQTIHHFLSSTVIMNCATMALFVAALAFFVCVTGREFRIYQNAIKIISYSAVGIFTSLLLYRTHFFWKFFKNDIDKSFDNPVPLQ